MHRFVGRMGIVFCVAAMVAAPTVFAQVADLETDITGPEDAAAGDTVTITVTYSNNGPNNTSDSYIDAYIPFGIPAGWEELTQDQFDALQNSAATFDEDGNPLTTTDTLGNVPLLFIGDSDCSALKFQAQGPEFANTGQATPVQGLDNGVTGTFTFELPIPADPKMGQFHMDNGPTAGTVFTRGNALWHAWGNAHEDTRFGGGADCDAFVTGCEALSDCFGMRLWEFAEPVTADFEIVDDGGVFPDPTLGCGPLVNDLTGKIAIMKRGECNFSDKVLFAEQAGAVAAFMVNDGRCGDWTASDDCVTSMTAADLAPLINIPVLLVSVTDGMPVFDAVDGGETITATFGNMPVMPYKLDSYAFHSGTEFESTDPPPAGEQNNVGVLDVNVASGPTECVSFIPAAALAAGLEGAFFQTDVDVNNKGEEEATFYFLWLPRGEDNSEPAASETYTLGPGESLQFENVLAEAFGAEPDVVGALAIVSSSCDVIAVSRTYNLPGGKVAGTFGQALPAVPSDQLITGTDTQRIIFQSENDDFRANVGCVNGNPSDLIVTMELYDNEGNQLEVKTLDLGPWSNGQITRIFRDHAPLNGYVDVFSNTDGAAYYCYGSVLDNETSDPTTVLPQVPGDMLDFIPAAALAAGLEGSFFQTDLDINNTGSEGVDFNILWLPRGADNSEPTPSETFFLGAGMGVRYENVLSEVFGAEPDAVGALAVSAADSSDLISMSRTYNIPTAKVAGTFGQALPGVPMSNMITPGTTKRIIFLNHNDDFRANVGCVNGVNQAVRVNIDLYDGAGEMLEARTMDLPPWSNKQFNGLFSAYAPVQGYADVYTATEGASVYCYGSVLDNQTSDPTTVLPQ